MGHSLAAVCDDFYISGRLYLKLDMTLERDTVLHFLDRIRKEYPRLCKLRRTERNAIILEEEPDDHGSRRWIRIDAGSLRFGQYAPPNTETVQRFGGLILTQAPYHFSFTDIDYDHLEVIYGFDLDYSGNHDQLVAETFWADHFVSALLFGDEAAHVIDAQPYFGIALTKSCDLQAYVEVKSRTTTYEVRNGTFEGEPISIFLTARKYWGLDPTASPEAVLPKLFDVAEDLAVDKVVPHFVHPLAAAIASRS
ncbi:MAG: hypothetical protein D6788_10700 [Planctomycetota bacterium]|nr:MAG: hypothetical protein D6788_10700 [Planctomycetota bacterium]